MRTQPTTRAVLLLLAAAPLSAHALASPAPQAREWSGAEGVLSPALLWVAQAPEADWRAQMARERERLLSGERSLQAGQSSGSDELGLQRLEDRFFQRFPGQPAGNTENGHETQD